MTPASRLARPRRPAESNRKPNRTDQTNRSEPIGTDRIGIGTDRIDQLPTAARSDSFNEPSVAMTALGS